MDERFDSEYDGEDERNEFLRPRRGGLLIAALVMVATVAVVTAAMVYLSVAPRGRVAAGRRPPPCRSGRRRRRPRPWCRPLRSRRAPSSVVATAPVPPPSAGLGAAGSPAPPAIPSVTPAPAPQPAAPGGDARAAAVGRGDTAGRPSPRRGQAPPGAAAPAGGPPLGRRPPARWRFAARRCRCFRSAAHRGEPGRQPGHDDLHRAPDRSARSAAARRAGMAAADVSSTASSARRGSTR